MTGQVLYRFLSDQKVVDEAIGPQKNPSEAAATGVALGQDIDLTPSLWAFANSFIGSFSILGMAN
jgi:hypothetical protein